MSQPSITNCPVLFSLFSLFGGIYTFSLRRPSEWFGFFSFFSRHVFIIQAVIASGFHLFPFRTEKLSPFAPMVLRNSGRVGRRRFFMEAPLSW